MKAIEILLYVDDIPVVEKCGPKTCFNLTLAAGTAPKDGSTAMINIKATDGAAYNINVYRKASCHWNKAQNIVGKQCSKKNSVHEGATFNNSDEEGLQKISTWRL
jgi:hypothetical protein